MKLSDNAITTILSIYGATWRAINLRVGATLAMRRLDHQSELGDILPHFARLAQATEVWRSLTFPGLIAAGEDLSQLALLMSIHFGELNTVLAQRRDTGLLPAEARAQVRTTLEAMHLPTGVLAAAMEELHAQIVAFHAINEVINGEIVEQLANLSSIVPAASIARLQAANQRIDSGLDLACIGWNDMVVDLRRVLSLSADVLCGPDAPASLEFGETIDFWRQTHREALAFSATLREIDAAGYCDDGPLVAALASLTPIGAATAQPHALLADYLLLACGLPPARGVSH